MSWSAQQNDGYAAQTHADPRHDPNPNPNPNPNPKPNPNPNPNPNPILWGALVLLSRSAGVVLSLRAILKTLHVRAIIRLVGFLGSFFFFFAFHAFYITFPIVSPILFFLPYNNISISGLRRKYVSLVCGWRLKFKCKWS